MEDTVNYSQISGLYLILAMTQSVQSLMRCVVFIYMLITSSKDSRREAHFAARMHISFRYHNAIEEYKDYRLKEETILNV